MSRALRSLALLALLPGCGSESYYTSGDMGITPGGSQDLNLAREIIGMGQVPRASQFSAEGLFSEHDLPLDGPDCEDVLCPRAAATIIDPIDGSGEQVLIQLGFGTKYQRETFSRPALNLAAVVDVSGSMQGDKLKSVKKALRKMVAQLDDGDTMSLVSFDDAARVERRPTEMDADGRDKMIDAINDLETEGSTNMEAGISLGFEELASSDGGSKVEDRVMLFTDAQPNVGSTSADSFLGIVRANAADGYHLSAFGVGLDLGADLATALADVKGANLFFLSTPEEIAQVFDEEFEMIVTPAAYDLQVHVSPESGLAFGTSYGAPLDDAGADVDFGASTLFFSNKNGGMGVTLVPTEGGALPDAGAALASFAMSYTAYDTGEDKSATADVSWAGGTLSGSADIGGVDTDADDLGVYKMGGLVDAYQALLAGDAMCGGTLDPVEAEARVAEAAFRVTDMNDGMGDAALAELAGLLVQLDANVEGGEDACAGEDDYLYY